MTTRRCPIAGLVVWLCAVPVAAQEIHLKTRDIVVGAATRARSSDTHQLVQFDHTPSIEDLDNLQAGGAQVISVVPDNAVVVSSPTSVVPAGPGIRSVLRLDAADKLSPVLAGMAEPFTVIVEFHSDVTSADQNAVASAERVMLQRPAVLFANHAIVTGSLADLQALAAHDEVAYIFPADPTLLTDSGFSACAGMLTLSGPIAQFSNLVHGWNVDSDSIAHLGYVFGSLTTKVTASLAESEVLRALNTWSQFTNVAFQPGTSATAARTLTIKFASGAHGDAYPFDGPGGILAHTFYPVPVNPESIAGDMHLDADENWHSGSDIDIYSVALHEAGHAIGLGHTDVPGDVMYPYYRRNMSLSANDIGAARALYGIPKGSSAPQPVTLAPAGLRLTVNTPAASTTCTQLVLTGIVSGGTAPFSVQWQTDHGYSGTASLSSALNWTASGIAMVNGTNTISVTVFDSSHQTFTQSVIVSLVPPNNTQPAQTSPVTVSITTPGASMVNSNAATISLCGTASGGSGIVKVTWQTSTGISGTATGTAHWLAPSVPLLTGTNTVIVRAYDGNGVNAWAAVVAVRN